LIIYGRDNRRLVTIDQDGLLTYDEGYDPDEAARTFWRCLADASPHQGLVDRLRAMLAEVQWASSSYPEDSLCPYCDGEPPGTNALGSYGGHRDDCALAALLREP